MIFTIKVSLCLFTFHVFVLTEPSYVPSPYVPDAEGAAVPPHQEPLNNVMIISCAFHKNWDFSGRIPMKTFFLVCGYFNLVRQPFDCSSFFGSRFATWSGPFPYKSKNPNKI